MSVVREAALVHQEITFRLKGYIQPFERVLARAELAGLLEKGKILDAFASEADDLQISTSVSPDYLRRRLAYWEQVGVNSLEPTRQVLYECLRDDVENVGRASLFDDDVYITKTLPKSRKLRYGVHNLHEYRGKFFPQLVKSLINSAGLREGSIVLDPTCGSGTTNSEARAMGMRSIGFDLNPLSVMVSTVKSNILSVNPIELETCYSRLKQRIIESPFSGDVQMVWDESDLRYLVNWFDERALLEIAKIVMQAKLIENPTIRGFFLLNLSNILRSVSWQRDVDLRVRKEVWEYESGMATDAFFAESERQLKRVIPYVSVVRRDSDLMDSIVIEGDARHVDSLIPNEYMNCDVLITSPPYATALPYIDTDRLSLIILGLLPRKQHRDREYDMIGNREISERQRVFLWNTYQDRKSILPNDVSDLIDRIAETNHGEGVGFRRRNLPALLSKYFLDMFDSMSSALKVMKPNSYAFYVVGNNSTVVDNERVEIATDRFLWEIGEMAGWTKIDTVSMELLPSRDIFRNNRGTSETILIFRSKG